MKEAFSREVTIQAGGVVKVESPESPAGATARVIVLVEEPGAEPCPHGGTGPSDLRRGKWRDELAFFDGAVGGLVNDPRYKGRYVAVEGRRIIDSDASDLELARRMARLHRGGFVLIAKVDTRARCVEVPSPEVFR